MSDVIYNIATYFAIVAMYGLWIAIGTSRIKKEDDVRTERSMIETMRKLDRIDERRSWTRRAEKINAKVREGYHVERTKGVQGFRLVSNDGSKPTLWYRRGI